MDAIVTDADLREDHDMVRAFAWRCLLADQYPKTYEAARRGFSDWADVEPLLSDDERTRVEALVDCGLPPWEEELAREPRRARFLPSGDRIGLLEYTDGAGNRRCELGCISTDGAHETIQQFERIEGTAYVREGAKALREIPGEAEPLIVATYDGPAAIVAAMARAREQWRTWLATMPRTERGLDLTGEWPPELKEASFWRGQLFELEKAWDLYHTALSGVQREEALRLRGSAAADFVRTVDDVFPLVHRRGGEQPLMGDLTVIWHELQTLLERIRGDVEIRDAEDIWVKFLPLLARVELAEIAVRIKRPRTAPGRTARQILARWQAVSESTIERRLRRQSASRNARPNLVKGSL